MFRWCVYIQMLSYIGDYLKIVTLFHNMELLGKAAGCAQQIMAQEMLTNLDLEKYYFYKSLVL